MITATALSSTFRQLEASSNKILKILNFYQIYKRIQLETIARVGIRSLIDAFLIMQMPVFAAFHARTILMAIPGRITDRLLSFPKILFIFRIITTPVGVRLAYTTTVYVPDPQIVLLFAVAAIVEIGEEEAFRSNDLLILANSPISSHSKQSSVRVNISREIIQ